jgi:hypothetical protein
MYQKSRPVQNIDDMVVQPKAQNFEELLRLKLGNEQMATE